MKQICTLITALFCSVIVFGQSKLSISSTGNADIRVMIDGKKYTASNNMVMVNNLKNGNHSVKVFRLQNDRNRNQANNRNPAYQLVYSGNVFVKPQYHLDIMINRFGKAFVDEQLISGGYNDDDDDDWGVDNNDQYYDRYSRRAMEKAAFDQLKQSLRKENFDDTRLRVARQVVSSNFFTAAQVKELVSLFSFEDSRLEMAKYAYDNTIDKGNYFMVGEAFNFSSTKESLMNYIQTRK